MSKISINSERLSGRLHHLSSLTIPDKPWERTAFSPLHKEARAWLTDEMQDIGLETDIDAGGNLIGTLSGLANGAAPIAVGSHSDTVPSGGRYDGVAGVVVAMEIAHSLQEAGHRLKHPLQVIDFLAEEPNKYGLSCVGSRAILGYLTPEMLAYEDGNGSTLADGIAEMGGRPEQLTGPLRKKGETAAFMELHIEQARVLEAANEDIGAVTGIVGIARIEVEVSGMADHAGATPMDLRRDALTASAEMVLAFEEKARQENRAPMVATVGKLDVSPNASNAVPGRVTFTLEVRSGSNDVLTDFISWVSNKISDVAQERGLAVKQYLIGQSEPVGMDNNVQAAILTAAREGGLAARSMPSGAGHDAAYMARIAPTGMVFIPCLEGRSHCPEEYATPEQLAKGAQTMLDALLLLDASLD